MRESILALIDMLVGRFNFLVLRSCVSLNTLLVRAPR